MGLLAPWQSVYVQLSECYSFDKRKCLHIRCSQNKWDIRNCPENVLQMALKKGPHKSEKNNRNTAFGKFLAGLEGGFLGSSCHKKLAAKMEPHLPQTKTSHLNFKVSDGATTTHRDLIANNNYMVRSCLTSTFSYWVGIAFHALCTQGRCRLSKTNSASILTKKNLNFFGGLGSRAAGGSKIDTARRANPRRKSLKFSHWIRKTIRQSPRFWHFLAKISQTGFCGLKDQQVCNSSSRVAKRSRNKQEECKERWKRENSLAR